MALVGGLPHLGLMHLVATNLVLWMRTVIRESIHEFHVRLLPAFHVLESEDHGHHGGHSGDEDHQSLNFKLYNNQIELCMKMYADDDFVTSILKSSSPFLYAFIVEFSLVAVTFFFSTWTTVGCIDRSKNKNVGCTFLLSGKQERRWSLHWPQGGIQTSTELCKR